MRSTIAYITVQGPLCSSSGRASSSLRAAATTPLPASSDWIETRNRWPTNKTSWPSRTASCASMYLAVLSTANRTSPWICIAGRLCCLGGSATAERVQAELRPGGGELVGGGLVEGEPHEAVGLLAGRGRPLEPQRPWTALPCPVHGAIGDHRDTSRPRATIDARGRRRGGRP